MLRAGKGISQGELARRMGLSQTNLCNIENGKTKATLKNLFKVQEILGCSMRDFFEDAAGEETFNMEEIMDAVRVMKQIKLAEAKSE